MRRTRFTPVFRSAINLPGGAATTQDNVPMIGNVNGFGALWVVLMTGGAANAGSLTSVPDNADDVAVTTTNLDLLTVTRNTIFDGVDWDRLRSASSGNLLAKSGIGVALFSLPGQWTAFQTPAAATQATCNRAASAGVAHVCNSIEASVSGVAAQGVLVLVLRDGATGVGTIIWSTNMGPFVIGTSGQVSVSGLNIVGTAGNAMCLEFTVAPAATNFESVAMTGFDAVA